MRLHLNRTLLFFTLLFSIILGLQWSLIKNDPITSYDDHILLDPLKSLGDSPIRNYIQKVQQGEILDIQPVRDFSLWSDLAFSEGIHHLHNVIIWFESIIFLFLILNILGIKEKISYALISLFALHPSLWNSVSWISARKHLLSLLSISAATFFFLWLVKEKKFIFPKIILILLFYTLACFAQPINLLWPVFVFVTLIFQDEIKSKPSLLLLCGLMVIALACAGVNFYYYSGPYVEFVGEVKFNSAENSILIRLLAFGRHIFQSLVPIKPLATPYNPESLLSYAGLTLLGLIIAILVKLRRKDLWQWFVFALLPILVVTIKITNIFGSDTYLLTPCLGLTILAAVFLNDHHERIHPKILSAAFASLLILFMIQSKQVADSFSSSYSIMKRSFDLEPTPFNLRALIGNSDYKNPSEETVEQSIQLITWDPYGAFADYFFATTIMSSQKMSDEQKMKLLSHELTKHPDQTWTRHSLGSLHFMRQEFSQAFEILDKMKKEQWVELNSNVSLALADLKFICDVIRKNTCDSIQEKINFAQSSQQWNEEKFQSRYKALKNVWEKSGGDDEI